MPTPPNNPSRRLADDSENGAPRLRDSFGVSQEDVDPDFPPSYTGWEGVTTDYDPWKDEGPPPDEWVKPEDWPDDWWEHIAEWREEGIAASTWDGAWSALAAHSAAIRAATL